MLRLVEIFFLLGDDFRQILPVIPGGTKQEIIDVSLNSSYLWHFFKIFRLEENMRLSKDGLNIEEKKKISDFAAWILQIDDGQILNIDDPNDDVSWIEIPQDLLIIFTQILFNQFFQQPTQILKTTLTFLPI